MNVTGTTFNAAFERFSPYGQALGGESTYEAERAEKREMARNENRLESQQMDESREMEMKEAEMNEADNRGLVSRLNDGTATERDFLSAFSLMRELQQAFSAENTTDGLDLVA